MPLFDDTRAILSSATAFVKSKNYFYEDHVCEATGKTERVSLIYYTCADKTRERVNFNICPHCKLVFYNETFESAKML